MPFVLNTPRSRIAVLGVALSLLVSGCNGKGTGNSATMQIKDLEAVDGTINDSMTDLDGVQSESVMAVDTGSNTNSSASTRTTTEAAENAASSSSPDDTEVVAEQ